MRTILATVERVEHFLEVLAREAFFSFAALNVPSLDDAEAPIPACTEAAGKG